MVISSEIICLNVEQNLGYILGSSCMWLKEILKKCEAVIGKGGENVLSTFNDVGKHFVAG